MKLLKKNEAILNQRFPEVLKRICAAKKTLRPAVIKYAEDVPILSFEVAGNHVYPYGKDASRVILRQWQQSLSLCSDTLYFTSGLGLGGHIEALLSKLSEGAYVFVWEEDPYFLGEVLSQFDLSQLIQDERLLLGVGHPDALCFQPLDTLHFPEKMRLERCIYGPLQAINPIMEAFAWKHIQEQYYFWKTHYSASLQDGTQLQKAVLCNLPRLLRAPDVGCTKNMFQAFPLVLVGAGPSLDASLEFIKCVEPHALIVCANSAYRSLLNAGIIPHLTVAIDPRYDTAKGYQHLPTDQTVLVCSSFVNPETLRLFEGHFLSWTGQSALARTIRVRLGLGEGTRILEQGTVSASIVDLARFWGCKKVCLVGQDMAYATTGQTHARDSFYSDEGRLMGMLDECLWVRGNNGEEVPTDTRLFTYLKTFENLVRDYREIEFINIAAQGAAIEGAPYMNQEAALAWVGRGSSTDFVRGELRALTHGYRPPEQDASNQCLSASRDFASRVFQTSLEAAIHCELMPDRMREKSYEKHASFRASDQYASSLNRLLDRYPRDYEVLFEGRTRAELAQYQAILPVLNKDTSAWGRSRANKAFFWSIAEGAHSLLNTLN